VDIDQNSRFLLKAFRRYYKENIPEIPSRFGRREFGFMFFDRTYVQRHISFTRTADLQRFLIGQVPSHCYYSTAYYQRPGAPTMEEKTWLGADLIFDLDADHLAGADKMTYPEMLGKIKEDMINLIDSFLLGDLGFSEDDIRIVFSGGRGYHAHVTSKEVIGLGSAERREIVDYITASGLSTDWVFPYHRVATSKANIGNVSRINVAQDRSLPPAGSGGWRMRMRNGLALLIDDICGSEPKDLRMAYPSLAGMQLRTLSEFRDGGLAAREHMFGTDLMAALGKKSHQDLLIRMMTEDVVRGLSSEIDEPVTADVKRLIRLPGSVHGKSGLRVVPLSRTQLDGFDPLTDAVPAEYSDVPVKITMRRDYEITIKGERFSLKGETEVPEYAAVFLVGRKAADIGHSE
jgi:DNA primase small subunit